MVPTVATPEFDLENTLSMPLSDTLEPWEGLMVARHRRIHLRTLRREDLPYLGQWADDPFQKEMVGSDLLSTFKEIYRESPSFLKALHGDPTQVVYVIAHDAWSKPLGFVRLFNLHVKEGYAFLETFVADQKALRLGFGIEASRLIVWWAMDVLGLRRLEAKVFPHNVLSINTMKRRGWKLEGVLREAVLYNGEYTDLLVFGILRHELEAERRRDTFTPTYYPVPRA